MVKKPSANAGDIRLRFDPWVGKIPWRRAQQSTPVLLPGEYGQMSLIGYNPQRCKELGTTEATQNAHTEVDLISIPEKLPMDKEIVMLIGVNFRYLKQKLHRVISIGLDYQESPLEPGVKKLLLTTKFMTFKQLERRVNPEDKIC